MNITCTTTLYHSQWREMKSCCNACKTYQINDASSIIIQEALCPQTLKNLKLVLEKDEYLLYFHLDLSAHFTIHFTVHKLMIDCTNRTWTPLQRHLQAVELTIKLGLLENLHFPDVHIMERICRLAWLLNVTTNAVWDAEHKTQAVLTTHNTLRANLSICIGAMLEIE